ncbi:Spx/MgsR family RNA polymerase-binding regulatory protein [Allobaculum stercoricanis]|uniref:Spx/MgsR family RNA polymerase-binding regulatory protein n=1 Tax=Allobaculum stercoricanis TaxID=174709 RepID=UPI000379FB9B|nr:Spx/MgsR family RNA polymerase-binding regulatory protein [Allobaculum stercoricanis]
MNVSVLFYTSPGCANCRKAKKWLEENHIKFVEKNILSKELNEKEIKYLLTRCENGTEDLLSTRSKAYEELRDIIDDMSIGELTHFIQQHPSVLKRPILVSRSNIAIGYDHDEITTMLPIEKRKDSFSPLASPIFTYSRP